MDAVLTNGSVGSESPVVPAALATRLVFIVPALETR